LTYDVCVVGAGFAGATVAERLAAAGARVLVVEQRSHVAGNAFDEHDAHGVLVHRYGPHIFHTNAQRVVDYLSQFTEWRPNEHRVRAVLNGKQYPIPINRDTINQLYGLDLDEQGVEAYLERVREPRSPIRTSEDSVLDRVGRDLYEKFFLNYTRKQWGLDPSQLAASVAARIPVRPGSDDRYFTDQYQLMPKRGYTSMFERMLDRPGISVRLNTTFAEIRPHLADARIVFTGVIDAYFDHCYGPLPYRSLRFEHEHLQGIAQHQSVGTVNYPNDHNYTRITEFKHLTGQEHSGTSIVREYPQAEGDPYYPVPRPENEARYKRYAERAAQERNVMFVGRLARYRYYNMDQVVAAALKAASNLLQDRTVVHFAAESHVDRSISGPDSFIETNVVGTHSLLKAARRVWLARKPVSQHRFHHVSTDEVYGSLAPHDPPCTEAAAFVPSSPYSASKAAADHLVCAYHRTYELDVMISNCSNNYGPHHFPEKLIPLMIVNLLQGKPLPIYGDGRYVRDWLYVDDHCRAIDLVLDAGRSGEVYNVGGESQVENLSVVERLCTLADRMFESASLLKERFPQAPPATGRPSASLIEHVRDRPGHDRRYAIDCSKITKLGYRPTVMLDEGLSRTLAWSIDNEPWWRAVMDGSYRRAETFRGLQ
jgi:UDP-galactopyranose mutase